MKNIIFILIFMFNSINSQAMDIYKEDDTKQIILEGKIEVGDFEKFKAFLKESGSNYYIISIFSPGGNALEAIKIGRLIRSLKLDTRTMAFQLKGERKCIPTKIKQTNCTCESACFLIFSGGVNRAAANVVGIHRVYIDHNVLKNLKGKDAIEIAKIVKKETTEYLKEMNIDNSIITKIFSIESDSMHFLTNEELNLVKGFTEDIQEWIKAKCIEENKYDKKMNFAYHKMKKGIANKDEMKALESDSRHYLKLAECESEAMMELRKESWEDVFSK